MKHKHVTTAASAKRIWQWLNERGGIAVWYSANLSNPLGSWTTPALQEDGTPTAKPTWEASSTPTIITDPADVLVSTDAEVKRFPVAVRFSTQGTMLKLTAMSTKRVRDAVEKAGIGAYCVFDYNMQEAVIMAPTCASVPIAEYMKSVP